MRWAAISWHTNIRDMSLDVVVCGECVCAGVSLARCTVVSHYS